MNPVVANLLPNINEIFQWKGIFGQNTLLEFNKTALMAFISTAICIALFWAGSRRRALVPTGVQNAAEMGYEMVEENIGRPDLVDLANRVTVVRDLEREKKGRPYARGVNVEVRLKDGKTLKKTVDFYLGSYMRPMTHEQMATKFQRLASKTLSPKAVTELEGTVRSLESAPTVTKLIKVLQGDRR